ncbi:MAG: GTPase ObgE [Nitriliruptoraceae bacterium]
MDSIRFVDECTVFVRGGAGGNGSVSFRREAHVPRGGPDGGDGGRGGHVIVVADANVSSLLDVHRSPHLRGGNGGHGAGMARTGATGQDRIVAVPVGTIVKSPDTARVLADLTVAGQQYVAAAGGRGGRGNLAFTNRHRRVPTFAERGEKTGDTPLRLELKLIADVGLIGFPSAGKSSLVSRLSSATPRIAAWPFTTLTPHLGVMRGGNRPTGEPIDVVLADVPGLIEGASQGKGLGLQFLRHVERCHVLLHVLDGAPFEPERDPIRDLDVLRHELAQHDPSMLERPQLIVVNKVDVPDGRAMAELARDELVGRGEEVLEVSAVTGEGLDTLRYRLGELVAAQRDDAAAAAAATAAAVAQADGVAATPDDAGRSDRRGTAAEVVIELAPRGDDFSITHDGEVYVVSGKRIERWVQMLPVEEPQAMRYLQGRLRRAGVERALVAAGARTGDDVDIAGVLFTFDPELADLPADERAAILAAEAEDARREAGDTWRALNVPAATTPDERDDE